MVRQGVPMPHEPLTTPLDVTAATAIPGVDEATAQELVDIAISVRAA